MGYNEVIVCDMVIKSDERVVHFHQTGSISTDRSDCWLWTQPILHQTIRLMRYIRLPD